MTRNLFFTTCMILIMYFADTSFSGCAKDYSYEGGPAVDTLTDTLFVHDSTVVSDTRFPYCEGCHFTNDTISLFWKFTFDTSLLCGNISNAVITPGREGFTFFGPSSCSVDTGLVMTVFLDTANALNKDQYNITTNNVSLQYYDNTTQSDIFISTRPSILFTIDSYNHSTGMASVQNLIALSRQTFR